MIDRVVADITNSIKTKQITEETERFLIHWLSDEQKTESDREIFRQLAKNNVFPDNTTNLFRGCKKLLDDVVESYSKSIIEATRFAGKDGVIISTDTSRYCFKNFALSNYLFFLCEEIILGERENCFSEEFIEAVESCSGEDEVLMITDLAHSVVLKISSIGDEL